MFTNPLGGYVLFLCAIILLMLERHESNKLRKEIKKLKPEPPDPDKLPCRKI